MTLASFLIAFALTNALEFFQFSFFVKKPLKQRIAFLFSINAITFSTLWIVLPIFFDSYLLAFIVAETAVFFVEAILIFFAAKLLFKQALIASFTMNFVSAIVGFFLI